MTFHGLKWSPATVAVITGDVSLLVHAPSVGRRSVSGNGGRDIFTARSGILVEEWCKIGLPRDH
jgi:hypothetical protein